MTTLNINFLFVFVDSQIAPLVVNITTFAQSAQTGNEQN